MCGGLEHRIAMKSSLPAVERISHKFRIVGVIHTPRCLLRTVGERFITTALRGRFQVWACRAQRDILYFIRDVRRSTPLSALCHPTGWHSHCAEAGCKCFHARTRAKSQHHRSMRITQKICIAQKFEQKVLNSRSVLAWITSIASVNLRTVFTGVLRPTRG